MTQRATERGAATGYADAAIAFARAQIGKPYVWGATGPNSYDCSGLIYRAYITAGFTRIAAYRTTYQMVRMPGRKIARADLMPGDLVFPNPGHVQLYVGNGRVIESPQAGENVRNVPMWGFWTGRRIVSPGSGSAGASGGAGFSGLATANPVSDIGSGLGDAWHALEWIIDPHNWMRIGEAIAGTVVVFVAIKSIGE